MTNKMTEHDFLDLISSRSAKHVLDRLAKMPAKERGAFAKPAKKLFNSLDRFWILADSLPNPDIKDGEAVTIGMLATASASELKRLSFFPELRKIELVTVIRKLDPDWTQDVVDHFVEDRILYVGMFQPLWEAGLCKRPDSDAIILNYYSHWGRRFGRVNDETMLAGDVWRFFEVEGGGEDSLANHDKFIKRGQESWADRLKGYAHQGKLDRQRLLDASLDALQRDFAQYRAGWYSRFHVLIAPDAEEIAARSDRYLRLLASSIPPTVSFAMKYVQTLDKAGVIAPDKMIAALEPALQARAKGTVTSALKLLLSAAKRKPELRAEAAAKAVLALISEDAGVQGKILDTIETLGVDPVTAELADFVDLVAPSVRPRIAALAGVSVKHEPMVAPPDAGPTPAQPVMPAASADAALALFLQVLEDPRDPFAVERAIDGIARFGVALQADSKALSPLRKRAKQVCNSPGDSELRYVMALTGRAFAERVRLAVILNEESGGQSPFAFVSRLSLQEFHLARNREILKRIMAGTSLPLLSLPSETSGLVNVGDLLARLALYRDASVDPEPHDLALALMRLSPEGRDVTDLPVKTEADRALAYALGHDVQIGPSPELWAAAWRARLPEKTDPAICGLFKEPTTECGSPSNMDLIVARETSKCSQYHWIRVKVPVKPSNTAKSRALPALFGAPHDNYYLSDCCCGTTFADIAWASLTRPADPEPLFRIALLHQETSQTLSDNYTRAYLEPLFRPGGQVGPLAAGTLAYYMACEDKSVSSVAAEAAAVLAGEGRLTFDVFVPALKQFLMSHALPTARWTKAMKGVADMGGGAFAREVIVGLLDFAPDETPRDIGGMLELCFELHVSQNALLTDPDAIACLQSIPGGGKTARFSKKLLSMVEQG